MFHEQITDEQADLIRKAPIFFIASAAPGLEEGPDGCGPVNLSPRGGLPLHIFSPSRVAFVDYRGSGNETARHAAAGGAVTLMVCSFEPENAAIVRLYGKATAEPVEGSALADRLMPGVPEPKAVRQIISVDVSRTQTSCGYVVPVMDFVRDRQKVDRGRAYK